MGVEVIAELNDWVRELFVEDLPAGTVADIAEQLETDDAVAMLEDLDEDDQQAVLAEMEPEDRAAMVEDDGMIHATCEYCSTVYKIAPEEIEQSAA